MNRKEAVEASPRRSAFIINYINKMLIKGNDTLIEIDSSEFNSQVMLTFNIKINGTDNLLNTGIPINQSDALNSQIIKDLLDNYLLDESLKLNYFMTINSVETNFSGVIISSINKTLIGINFKEQGPEFNTIINNYNNKIKSSLKENFKQKQLGSM